MLYSATTQALSATTAWVINGSEPYLTFDNGVTKVTTSDGLLGITLSDGTHITPAMNTSATTPIVLPSEGETLANVQMLVPLGVDSIALNDLISTPNNYWGDDDGDGQGVNGITASGSLSVSITDNIDQTVSRNATLDICKAPYKVVLTSTEGSLTSKYGIPNSRSFEKSSAAYYINPKTDAIICYARPNLNWGYREFSGPTSIWNYAKGFLVQSTEPSTYSRNFPTTGANNLHFDLLIGGNTDTLTWPTVTHGGITATMIPNPPKDIKGINDIGDFNYDGASSVRVTLTGPVATDDQIKSASPGPVSTPSLPQQFEIVGYDSKNKVVVKYGFELKQWFVGRKKYYTSARFQESWCSSLGGGYHLPQVKDLTNSACGANTTFPCVGVVSGTPSSTKSNYQRNIGAGLFAEWGVIFGYASAHFGDSYYWTSDKSGSNQFYIYAVNGYTYLEHPSDTSYATCVYP